MEAKLINNTNGRVFAVVFEEGEDPLPLLKQFASEYNLTASELTGIGAFSRVTLGFFEMDKQDYRRIPVEEQVEVLSLTGNISLHESKPKVHVHVVVGKRDGTAMGGQLMEAAVRPTLEVLLTESPDDLQRTYNEKFGIPLLNL